MKLAALCLIALAACTDLPAFEEQCGNFEIDRGEDCDEGEAATERCDSCRLVCDANRTCHGFAGYACGADGYCRAPSGRLASTITERATLAHTFMITDVDRDYYADVVSVSGTSLTVNYGDPVGDLAFQASTLIPSLSGEPTFTDIDGDESTDVVIPTADGVAAYSSPFSVLSPHPFVLGLDPDSCPLGENLEGMPFHVFPLDDNHVAVLVSRVGSNKLGVAVINTDDRDICADPGTARQVCDVFVGDSSMGEGMDPGLFFGFAEYDTSTPTSRGKMIAVTSALPGGGSCVIDFRRETTESSFTSTEIFTDPSITQPAVLADIDGTGCPSLIDTISDPMPPAPPQAREFRAQGSPGACGLTGTSQTFPLPPGTFAVGSAAIDPLAAGSLVGSDAVVTTDGIYAIPVSRVGAVRLYVSDRPLTSATSADIDADGDLDIIAVSQGAEDIDVILRTSGDNFLLLRLDTVGAVTLFVVGDFDGNEVSDIAYTELFVDSQRLNIAYGTRDRPLEPADAGAFRYVVGLVPIQTSDSTDPNKIVDDLIVLDIVDKTTTPPVPVMTLLHGSPQRTMQSFFDPRKGTTAMAPTTPTVFTGVAAGNFFATPGAARYVDLVAIDGARSSKANVWPLEGTSYGAFSYSTSTDLQDQLGSCITANADGSLPLAIIPQFCTDSAVYTTWAREVDNDRVIGIDHGSPERRVMVLDPLDPGSGTSAPSSSIQIAPFPFGAEIDELDVRSMRIADLDGDGRPELIVAFAPQGLVANQGAILRCNVNDGGMPTACTNLAADLPELAGMGCVDATIARVTPAGIPTPPPLVPTAQPPAPQDLVVVCHRDIPLPNPTNMTPAPAVTVSELFRVYHQGGGFRADSLTVQLGSIERLQAGDVTGDGLDDILGIRINRSSGPSLVVLPQCASNDDACGAEVVTQGGAP
jgi:hypothetical protein